MFSATSAEEWSEEVSQRASRPAGEWTDLGADSDRESWRKEDAERIKGPLISRRVAARALIWSSVLQAYEVLSNMLTLPGWVWGVAGFAVTAPDVLNRAKDMFKRRKGKQ
jgi:hypothetical protein